MASTSVAHSWLSSIPSFNPSSSQKDCAIPMTNYLRKEQALYRTARFRHSRPLYATLRSPKGFGPPPKKKKKQNKDDPKDETDDESDGDEEEDEEREAGVIPEIVTNRMMTRMAFTVGTPLFTGLLFFPIFYYLRVGLKINVPTWVPFIVSFAFFGTALAGVSYGIVSSSWDPMREGSFWGWNEARRNWPVFWQSFWGISKKK